jgi:hypothetical protein
MQGLPDYSLNIPYVLHSDFSHVLTASKQMLTVWWDPNKVPCSEVKLTQNATTPLSRKLVSSVSWTHLCNKSWIRCWSTELGFIHTLYLLSKVLDESADLAAALLCSNVFMPLFNNTFYLFMKILPLFCFIKILTLFPLNCGESMWGVNWSYDLPLEAS